MNISIRIDYIGDGKISQAGSFPLRGRTPQQVALAFCKQIKKESSYRAILEKVTANEQDITQLVRDLEKEEWKKAEKDMNENYPFKVFLCKKRAKRERFPLAFYVATYRTISYFFSNSSNSASIALDLCQYLGHKKVKSILRRHPFMERPLFSETSQEKTHS